ncbi:MAG TPA: serine/threonine-protein kinase [Myxococcales bacterium]|jgi:serine/threonine-protein kinase
MAGHARYTVLQKIADGGMAEIYLGTQHGAEGFHRPIVIKRIRSVLSVDPKFRNMLVDEAHIAMSLVHSNIVQVLDLGTARGSDFLVLELVDGWDLHQLLSRSLACDVPLPPALALHVMVETCRGLAYAHTRRRDGKLLGIVHRDISPHNVLVSEQGEVKLTDFGIATAVQKREQTLAGTVKGKLGFMSPEQARGEPLDHRSDIFSVGTTLYVLVTGRRPYSAGTDLEILLRMQQADFPPAEKIRPDLAPEVVGLLHKAMQKQPEARYQSAEEMLVDLERVQRAVYGPAGQTELKRWLATLSERDGVLPTSLRPPKPVPEKPGSDQDAHAGRSGHEIPRGSEIMLEEVEPDAMLASGLLPATPAPAVDPAAPKASDAPAVPAVPAAPAAVDPAAPPASGAAPAAAAEPAPPVAPPPAQSASIPAWSAPPIHPSDAHQVHFDTTFIDEPYPEGFSRRKAMVVAGVVAILGALAWWLAPVAPALMGMAPSADASAGGLASAVAPQGDAGPAAAAAEPAAAAVEPVGSDPTEPLATGSADAGTEVAGEAGAETETALETGDTISARFVSIPAGASVKVLGETYGVTPINVRFKAELMYEVVLKKDGYQTLQKRIYVPRRKNQVFTLVLEKKKWWQP